MSILGRILGRQHKQPPQAASLSPGFGVKSVEVSPALQTAIEQQLMGYGLNPALGITAFYRGAMAIAEGVAQLPIEIYRKSGKGVEPAIDHPLYDLLHYQPFEMLDSFQFWRTVILHAVVMGDSVTYRNVVNGETRELIPIRPEGAQVRYSLGTYQQLFDVTFANGSFSTLSKENIFHLTGPRWEPHRAMRPTVTGARAITLARMTEETQTAFHQNGARPSGFIKSDKGLTKDQLDAIKEDFANNFGGSKNTGQVPVFHGGMDYKTIAMTGVDAEHLDTRKHQIEEIARILGVFPIILGHAGDQSPTFASAETFIAAHVKFTLQPWIRAVTMAVMTQLLTSDERRNGYFCRVDTGEFTRGSLKDRTEYWKAALGSTSQPGWASPNEARIDMGLNPDDDEGSNDLFRPAGAAPDVEDTVDAEDSTTASGSDAADSTEDSTDE